MRIRPEGHPEYFGPFVRFIKAGAHIRLPYTCLDYLRRAYPQGFLDDITKNPGQTYPIHMRWIKTPLRSESYKWLRYTFADVFGKEAVFKTGYMQKRWDDGSRPICPIVTSTKTSELAYNITSDDIRGKCRFGRLC